MKKQILGCLLASVLILTSCQSHSWDSSNSSSTPSSEPVVYHQVTFDANGGQFDNGLSKIVMEVEDGWYASKPDDPTRANCDFLYWREKSKRVEFDFYRPITEDVVLLAKWEIEKAEITRCDIPNSYFDEEKQRISVSIFDKTVNSISISDQLELSPGATMRVFDDNGTYSASNIPLAKITNIFTIEVTSKNGGIKKNYSLTITKEYNVRVSFSVLDYIAHSEYLWATDQYDVMYIPYVPEGYIFHYWTLEGSDERVDVIPVIEDITLYAKLEKIVVTCVFDANGGVFSNGEPTKEFQVDVNWDICVEVPTWENHTFLGFYYGDAQITGEDGKGSSPWPYYGKDIFTIYARWGGRDYLKVLSFDSQEGSSPHYNDSNPHHIFYGEMYLLPVVEKSEQEFLGWWLDDVQLSDGFGNSLAPWTYEEYKTYNLVAHYRDPIFVTEYYLNDELVHTSYNTNEEFHNNFDLWVYETDNPSFLGWSTNPTYSYYYPSSPYLVTKAWQVQYSHFFAKVYGWIDE